jgi:hypothetical protein
MEAARPEAGLHGATFAGVIGVTVMGHLREAAEPFPTSDD